MATNTIVVPTSSGNSYEHGFDNDLHERRHMLPPLVLGLTTASGLLSLR